MAHDERVSSEQRRSVQLAVLSDTRSNSKPKIYHQPPLEPEEMSTGSLYSVAMGQWGVGPLLPRERALH